MLQMCVEMCVWSSFEPCGRPWRYYPLLGLPHVWFYAGGPAVWGFPLGLEMGCTTVTDLPFLVCKQMPLTTTDHLATSMASQARGSYNWKWRKGDQVGLGPRCTCHHSGDSQVHVGICCDTHHPPAPVIA